MPLGAKPLEAGGEAASKYINAATLQLLVLLQKRHSTHPFILLRILIYLSASLW